MSRTCHFDWSRCAWCIIFLLATTSVCLAQGRTSGKYVKSAGSVPDTCYVFYGGDFDPNDSNANALPNETDAIVGGSPYGAATYQNFVVSSPVTVIGLFTNNLSGLNPATGYWEIRTGVSAGNGGTLIASGTSAMIQMPTGRGGFGLSEFRDEVDGLNIVLTPGTYWFAVVPQDPSNSNRSFNSNTTGLNSIGTQISNLQFFNSPVFGANYDNANNQGVFPTFSGGVIGDPSACGAPTSVALTITPPNPTAGQVVTLSAAVTSASNAVDIGSVTFLDATQTLGTVQLNKANGIAVLKTRLGPGTYTVTARYNGTNSFRSSTASPQILIVTGTEPTSSVLTETPDGQNYDFGLSVLAFGIPPLSGSAAVTNITQNQLVGTITIPGPGLSTLFPPLSTALAMAQPSQIAVGDFRGIGNLDLAITDNLDPPDNRVLILLGDAAGNFTEKPPITVGDHPTGIAVGDFNDDGNLDLAVVNQAGPTFQILLGHGDGTFTVLGPVDIAGTPSAIAAGDFNGDGELDLAVTDIAQNRVHILIGSGNGSFTDLNAKPAVGSNPFSIVVGDFNQDGIPDLAVANFGSNTVSVLLGDGLGGFTPTPIPIATGPQPSAITAAHFDSDAFLDLGVAIEGGSAVSVFLGDGTGKFTLSSSPTVGTSPDGVAVADFNGDGFQDLVVTNQGSNDVSVLLGIGDGTFQAQKTYPVGSVPSSLAVADFNGDSVPDLITTNILNATSGTTSLFLAGSENTGSLLNVPVFGKGIQQVQSNFAPNGTIFEGGLSNMVPVNGDGPNPSTTTLASNPNPSTYGGTVTFTATVSGVGGLPTGTVTFTADGNVIAGCSAVVLMQVGNNAQAICMTATLSAGTHNIVGNYSGDANFAPSSGTLAPPQVVNRAATTTILSSSLNPSTYLQPVTFTATVSGPVAPTGAVTFTSDGKVICSAVQLVPMGNVSTAVCMTSTLPAGTRIIVASYSGDNNFLPSTSPNFEQVVNQAIPSITVTPYAVTYDGSPHIATGTAKGVNNEDLSADLNLGGTQHTNAGDYPKDLWIFHDPNNNYRDAEGTVHDVINLATTSTIVTASPPSPSQFGQTVTFTAVVSGSNGGSPTGTVSFTADNAPIAGCSAVALIQQQNSSTAVCQTSSLTIGSHTVLAAYGGDRNFNPSSGSLAYTVVPPGDFMAQVSPGSITVIQGFTNENEPYLAETVSVTAQPVNGYSNSVSLSCSVTPQFVAGSCTVNAPSSGSLAGGSLSTTLTISAGSATPIGAYTVTVSAQDNNQVTHTATLALTVIEQTTTGKMKSGGTYMTMVNLPGDPDTPVGNFACTSVSGTGINGSEDFSQIGGVCTFNPGTINLPDPVEVTLSGCTVARLGKPNAVFASFFFGLPGAVILGPLILKNRKRKKLMQFITLILVTVALVAAFGCGGYGPLTPTGQYYVLVQGTGPGGATYSAVVPLTVTK